MSKKFNKGDFVTLSKGDFFMSSRPKRITNHTCNCYHLADDSGLPVRDQDDASMEENAEVAINQDGILELLRRLKETLNAIFDKNDIYITSNIYGSKYHIYLVDRLSDLCVELTNGYYEDDEMECAIRTFEREKQDKE